MKKKLVIIGAGNVGGFVAQHISDFGDYELLGFLDEHIPKHGTNFCGYNVLGGLNYLASVTENICVAVALANPIVKSSILKSMDGMPNISFPAFIHPKAWLGKDVIVGRGSVIYPGVSVNYGTKIADFCNINMNCAIGHDCSLDNFTTLSPGVNLGGFTQIGECSFLGIGASTIQGVTIGKEVTIGGMTMVLKDAPDGATIVGNPGKIIKCKEVD